MAKYPVKDHQVAKKTTPAPGGRCLTCANKTPDLYGHCNKQLGTYLVFHCDTCRNWWCGQCYQATNPNREGEEACPTCGPVKTAGQISSKEWFPPREVALTPSGRITVSTMSSSSTPTVRYEPYSLNLSSSRTRSEESVSPVTQVTPVTPPISPLVTMDRDLPSLFTEISALFNKVKAENEDLKARLTQEEEYRKKYEELKKKLALLAGEI